MTKQVMIGTSSGISSNLPYVHIPNKRNACQSIKTDRHFSVLGTGVFKLHINKVCNLHYI
nr:MAG TPA: hypothetical protein [Caudoviricetes sp.]